MLQHPSRCAPGPRLRRPALAAVLSKQAHLAPATSMKHVEALMELLLQARAG